MTPGIIARWGHLYGDHKAVSAAVTYVHFVGVVLGGGFALFADRAVLRLAPARDPDWSVEVARFASVHRWVIAGLALSFGSGVLMALADLDTFLPSGVFWGKMALILVLVGNGWAKLRAEADCRTGGLPGWRRLRRTAQASVALWLAVLLAGTLLTTI